jgi:hypothetical protein
VYFLSSFSNILLKSNNEAEIKDSFCLIFIQGGLIL